MQEKETRLFIGRGSGSLAPDTLVRHSAMIDNVSSVVTGLEENGGLYGTNASRARQLVDEGRALLWIVEDPAEFSYIIAPGYVIPDPDEAELIPAIIVNGTLDVLVERPSLWVSRVLDEVSFAIINLPPAYDAALRFTQYHFIDRNRFFEILERGDPTRQRIVPLWELISG